MLFREVIGQSDIKSRLIRTVADGRVAHAQLFYGGEGHGKLALALAYAQFISCRDTEKFSRQDSCGVCPSCIKFNKLVHPDLHFIYPVAESKLVKLPAGKKPESRTFVSQWREMIFDNNYYISLNDWYHKLDIEKKQAAINVLDCNNIITTLSYSSYESEYKIMLIWMIEKLNYQAAPKLLKILEEPPEKTIFLLVAEQIDMIISTILSRLHQVKIPKINDTALLAACKTKLGLPEDKAREITHLAKGSFKEAMKLQHQTDVFEKNFNKFVTWMRMCWAPDVPSILDFSSDQGKENREQSKQFLKFGLEALRSCLMLNLNQENLVRMIPSEKEFYTKFSPFVNQSNISFFSEEFNKAIYHIERNVHGGMIFLDLSLTISKLLRIKDKTAAT
jgi:DNA polymerase-3 subunit delta'